MEVRRLTHADDSSFCYSGVGALLESAAKVAGQRAPTEYASSKAGLNLVPFGSERENENQLSRSGFELRFRARARDHNTVASPATTNSRART